MNKRAVLDTIAFALGFILAYMALHEALKAHQVGRAYEIEREQLEALQRTVGHINPAFKCRAYQSKPSPLPAFSTIQPIAAP